MTILTPTDVAERMRCTEKEARKIMASIGCIYVTRKEPRILAELFDGWSSPERLSQRLLHSSRWGQLYGPGTGAFRDPFVYFIQGANGCIKIGFARDIDVRLRGLQIASAVDLKILAAMRGGSELEAALHVAFRDQHERGEWFRREGALAELLERAPQ